MKILVDYGEPLGALMDVPEARPIIRIPIIGSEELIEIEKIGIIMNGPRDGMPVYRVKE